eukprot:CAMPEP_0119479572 /NCGR_PEP_ID=MMETSP1344-20130328/8778_1 /TAXON_ID=236787 /ORGANISM="Florenciella parvula, Strain CCMP2471" /LENGTH=78 /DNA_ID=CAMNT_0007513813 /DNA_START=707 /DNA_END=939 /DNA_ORIENTATION=-
MVLQSLACGFEINGNVCVRAWLCVGLRLHHRRPRVSVEFELVRALANELRRAGEGPSFRGRDEGHHHVCPASSSAAAA